MSGRCRILACGSFDGGDDAAALQVVGQLRGDLAARARVEEIGQLSAEHLLDDPDDVRRLVIDCVSGVPSGQLVDLPLRDLPGLERRLGVGSSHALSIGQVVALADRLGGLHPDDRFIGIGGSTFALGAPASPAVVAGLPAFIARIEAWVG